MGAAIKWAIIKMNRRFNHEKIYFDTACGGDVQYPAALEVGDIKVTVYDLATFINNVYAEHFNGVMQELDNGYDLCYNQFMEMHYV